MYLTPEQKSIVNLNQGQHLVLAPPGTGKTELLVQRLAKAIAKGEDQHKMICLTFTNRAARNMLDRVEKEVGKHEVFIGNMHSYCHTFLRKGNFIANDISLLDEEDTDFLFREVLAESSCYVVHNRDRRSIKTIELSRYNVHRKGKIFGFPVHLREKLTFSFVAGNEGEAAANSLCKRYEKIKEESNFIDFDDLLLLAYRHLMEQKEEETLFNWLQIDEVQDLNPLQWAIIDKISSIKKSHRCFFGDYEQAIFSFMGAKLDVLDRVAKKSQVHFLKNNFRSAQYLLDLYNTYAKAWLHPKWEYEPVSKKPFPKMPGALRFQEVVTQHEDGRYGTLEDEIHWIVSNKLPREPAESTAILVSTNDMADAFAKRLNEQGVGYFKISGFDLFRRSEIKDIMAFMSVIVNAENRNAWIRIFHLYGRIKSLKEARVFVNYFFDIGLRPFDFVEEARYEKSMLDDFLVEMKEGRIVVFDTETTGLDTKNDDIIQIAAIEIVNGKMGETFEVFIDTDKDLSASEKIHHISKSHLKQYAIDKKEALVQFMDFVGSDVLLAHNVAYDREILNSNLKRESLAVLPDTLHCIDSINLSKRLYPKLPSYKLAYLLECLGIKGVNSHNALDDVKATVNLVLSFAEPIGKYSEARETFTKRYKTVFKNIETRYTPIYKAVSGHFSDELPLKEVISMVMGYMSDTLKYKTQENIYDELDKLLRHMDKTCVLQSVYASIQQYIPEYSRYKESDLVLGDEKIIIATIHKAKGLEFENVIIPACTDDNFPSYFSKMDGEEGILESARLLYVAMTRTKKRLLITSHTKKILPWREMYQKPSRFLAPVLHFFE